MKYLWLLLFLLGWCGLVVAQTDTNVVQPQSNPQEQNRYIRVLSGPGEGFIAIGALFTGDVVTPVNRSTDGAWVLILYSRNGGWIQRRDVLWQSNIDSLPVLAPNITPTALATATLAIITPTEQPLAGVVRLNDTNSAIVRAGPGRGYPRLGQLASGSPVEPIARNADNTWVLIPFADPTAGFDGVGWIAADLIEWRNPALIAQLAVMSETNLTPQPTAAVTATPSVGNTATNTPFLIVPTNTTAPSSTPTEATATFTATVAPSATNAQILAIVTNTPVSNITIAPTLTIPPTMTETIASTATLTAPPVEPTTLVPTSLPATEQAMIPTPLPIVPTPIPTTTDSTSSSEALPIGAIAIGVVIFLVLIYIGMFAQGMTAARRYEAGFVREVCPVCQRGVLAVEARRSSTFGVPNIKRTVRCTECRSVLREKGTQRWVYAVDRIENPTLFERYNGREISDDELKEL